jgi:riboflavin kinase/FMN adenylyltransferase
VKVEYGDKEYNGMLNIGVRPTFDFEDPKRTLEVHLLDFKGDLYGEYLSLDLIKRIRDEKKFDDRQQLMEEIEKDEVRIRNFFRK